MENAFQTQESALIVFGGLVAELAATQMPAGSAVICCDADFTVASVLTREGISPVYPQNDADFDYVTTFEMTDGGVFTLALDEEGVLWQEDAINDPGTLDEIYGLIEPGSHALSATQDDRQYFAFSDLENGMDMPRQWTGEWFDRVSQVGPAVSPAVVGNGNGYDIVKITQASPVVMNDSDYTVLWSPGSTVTGTGNILTIQARPGLLADVLAAYAAATTGPNLQSVTVIISGMGDIKGIDPNGTYVVIATGTSTTGAYGANSPYFSVQATQSNSWDQPASPAGSYQLTLATLTAEDVVPNITPGQQLTIAGASVAGYDNTWTVTASPNSASLQINDTSLTANIATYAYDLLSGSQPSAGQQVTVAGTTNGNGIFNVNNAVIQSVTTTGATTGSFTLGITHGNVSPGAETATGLVNGNIFQFDPMLDLGNSTGGSIVIAGTLAAGTRGCVVMFLTRNGYLTAPSPPLVFTIAEDTNSITISQIPIGPPNTVARVLAFTAAGGAAQQGGGGFYFWIPQPVSTLNDLGQTVVYNATIINDNSTTETTLTFTDAVLLAADSICDQGSDNFNQIELGNSIGVIQYADRLFFWGEQNKITNLLNPTFDGGIGQGLGTTVQTYPLGWTVDPTNGGGGSVVASPLFGNSYQISNTTGSTQSFYGMIEQGAYQDSNQVPIFQSATAYSLRVTAACPTGAASGDLVIDLYSPGLGQIWGKYSIALSSLASRMQILTGELLSEASAFAQVPTDLQIRLYAANIPNNVTVLVDRIEPFPTEMPVLTTQMRASYAENFEAFDGVTGNLGVASENQQAIRAAFVLYDQLYVVKENSLYKTSDNGITEPSGWTIREVSNRVGTPSIYGVDSGEGWALVASQYGLYVFAGGEPVKIMQEIAPLWQAINWSAGESIWVRNDVAQRKIYVGVPISTPNQWMPDFEENASPAAPNVVLMCSYQELMTASALIGESSVRQTFMGDLKTYSLGRKWSAWSISANYADFITRADATAPLFFCGDTGTGKIYQQLAGNYADDGEAMHFEYMTYGFVKEQEAQALGLGHHVMMATYASMTVVGAGNLDVTIYPDSPSSPYGDILDPLPLDNPPSYGDTEFPLNERGYRFFVDLSLDGPGEWCELSRVVMALKADPWMPVKGGLY